MNSPGESQSPTGQRRAGEASPVILEIDDLAMGFGAGKDVLRGVSVSVARGEFVTVIGPSGSGKSTVLNAVSGLQVPRAGRVEMDGQAVRGVNTAVGYMTQGDTLLPWRTVADNIELPLKMRKFPKAERKALVDSTLEMLELTDAAGQYPAQLSGGMRRRALLGRSMVYKPQMLLMDEPFAALDAELRGVMHVELLKAVRRLDQTVLFVTHDIQEAVLLSDRVIVIGGTPARALEEIVVPFGRDRDFATLRFEDRFFELERDVHLALTRARRPRQLAGLEPSATTA